MVKLTVAEAAERIAALPSEGVVITGGEPLLQADSLIELIDAIRASTPRPLIEIETNGSIAPSDALAGRVDLFMVSPKLAHSGNAAEIALKPEALSRFAQLETAYFKFVAKAAADIEAAAAIAQRHAIPPHRVYIMPEGTTSEALIARGEALIDATLAHGFNYTDRLHIHLFGQKRGV
jgi:organic radical activating enzyme